MDNLDVSQISDPNTQQPLTGPSIQFIQDAVKDSLNAAVRAIVGDKWSSSTMYVLNGLEMTGANDDISAGYVFYLSEVFFVAAVSNTAAFSDVPVLKPYNPTAHPTLDPVLFSDSVNRNVHNIRRMQIVDQASGSGSSDYADVVFVNRLSSSISTPAGFNIAGTSSVSTGVTFTAPTHDYNVEIYVEMDISVTWATNGRLGAQVKIKNLTTLGFYPAFCAVLDTTDTSAGKVRTQRLVATWRKTGIAASTNLEVFVENTQADQHSAGNIYIRCKEF